MRFFTTIMLNVCLSASVFASNIEFVENLGQWNSNAAFKVEIPMGSLFLEKDGLTYSLLDLDVYRNAHENNVPLPQLIRGHAFQMKFLGANTAPQISGNNSFPHYRNYFIGNDPDKWKSRVRSYAVVTYKSLYNGIDLKVYSTSGGLKYDLILNPGAKPSSIQMDYTGLDDIRILKNGDLELTTSLLTILEKSPIAFQEIAGELKEVKCQFVLNGSTVSFDFPDGYDLNHELIIDPQLIFSTYVGSTANNFGSSATYDNTGHLYGAGTTFGAGYPTTTGAFQTQPGQNIGGTADIGISKFGPDGSSLIFSTYIGGTANETVHSTVVNANDEVFILGTSISSDFPTTPNAFQTTNFGGQTVNWTTAYGMSYTGGCDMVISKLSADGTTLLGSTFMGGTENDGLNVGTALDYNYGDPFRGEVNVDDAGNVYVASCTESSDFPVTNGAAQPSLGGGRDGVVFKMNSNLSSLIWSTYVGGALNDNAYAIQLSTNGEIVVAGGTLSANFPSTAGAQAPNIHGQVDGWVLKLATDGSSFLASTYVGSSQYDQVYFVQFDSDDNVYVLGQTTGNIPTIPTSAYSNPNSGQFIQKFSNDLSTILVSTTVGTGSGEVDISPTAFLVSNCGQIYLSGWGGSTNNSNGNATSSTTNNLPITNDAFQPDTDGHDFYLMVLGQDATELIYATFFGGGISHEHVDGGTSRFDKNGVVYQAVCAGCGNHDDFPTTPGAWSATNPASCNLGVFKFDLNQVLSVPELEVLLGTCTYPIEVQFFNNSSGANTFIWQYGDGSTANVFEESHLYTEPGEYEVVLVAIDSLGCLNPDTGIVTFEIPFPPEITVSGSDTVCSEESVFLEVEGEGIVDYVWRPSETLDDPTSTGPVAIPIETTTYTVVGTDSAGCQVEEQVTIYVSVPPNIDAGINAYLEPGRPAQLLTDVPIGTSVLWSPPEGLSCTACPDPIANPEETTTYYVQITDHLGCVNIDSVIVYTYPTLYVPNAFTPGPNTQNPLFHVYGSGIADFEISIFNRWGQLVYESEEIEEGWDGTVNGRPAQQDVYVWKVVYTTDVKPGSIQNEFGHVTLLRNMD